MDPPSNARGAPREGPPEGVNKTVGSPVTDGSQEKQSGPHADPSPRPARLASPASSCRGGVAATPPPPTRQAPSAAAGGRSVKSIVEWLEGPKQPDSPPATNVASGPGRKTTSTVSVPSAVPDHHRHAHQGIAHAEDVEDYSLTYLNYKGLYQGAPLARCLDGVEEDLSKKSLEDIFKEAERNTASGRTVVNVTSPLSFSPAAAEEKTSTAVGEDVGASKHAASSGTKPANVEHAKVPRATAAGNAGAATGPANQGVSGVADGKIGVADPVATRTIATAGNQGSAAAPATGGPEGQEFIQRDPQEVEAF
ncbi:hypothetical protein G6O67_004338 [Ophiocordyceps sinensis]|uniref:Uncharacterized protein n=1 Tax=Ophiocordyceps sinensis TaxID=72228 RepID=A0A8H4M0E6_9HYPO|nr:hypothetical protein G6O67_004338 [Ophiocordyceps sinensis]